MKPICFWLTALCVLFMPIVSYSDYSHSPRQTGEIILDELLIGTNRFVIVVGSSGCTSKDSLKVDVIKKEDLTSKIPRYIFTIRRTVPDECKAIVEEGAQILYDIEKDLGIKGEFVYSLANQVYSSSRVNPSPESLWSLVEKHFISH